MSEKQYDQSIKDIISDLGFTVSGVADVSLIRHAFALDPSTANQFPRAISLGKRLLDPVIEDIQDRPTPLYFHHYRQLNFWLDRAAFLLASWIQDLGFSALPIPASQIIDWEKQMAHVSHKQVGVLAGLGWVGRNNLLIHPDLGARFRLVTVLTDLPLSPDRPLERGCGSCYACLASCPARAIKESQEAFDHQACYGKLREFRKKGLVGQLICGVCVKACKGPR